MAAVAALLGDPAAAVRGWGELLRPGGTLAISEFGDLDARWAWKDELLGRLGPLGGGHLGPQELESLLRSAGGTTVQVQVERLDVVYADAQAWWASSGPHGERRPLEQMDPSALAAYPAAFTAIEACREADGALHRRPEAIYAIASR
jgi:hypothetical protein